MRFFLVAVVLAVSACGAGTEVDPGIGDAGTSEAAPALPSGGGSDFCRTAQDLADDLSGLDEDDPSLEAYDLYSFAAEIYGRLATASPAELENDFAVVIPAIERYADWVQDPTQPDPLSDEEQQAFEAASTRIDRHLEEECGIDMGDDESDAAGVATEGSDEESGGASEATLVVTVGGNSYNADLSGVYEVSCDLYGDTDTGSIGIYLEGPEFQSSVSSYDSGVEPGTYEGQVWVFAEDPDLDELVWDLQELDGTFVLDRAEPVSDEEWLFAGSFSAAVDDPAASVEATFTCVGLIGF